MEEIPGLAHLRANSEVVEEVDNDEELVITIVEHCDSVMLGKMRSFGWVIRAPNVFAYIKPTYNDEEEDNQSSQPFLNEDGN
jgi:hypothetical protein